MTLGDEYAHVGYVHGGEYASPICEYDMCACVYVVALILRRGCRGMWRRAAVNMNMRNFPIHFLYEGITAKCVDMC